MYKPAIDKLRKGESAHFEEALLFLEKTAKDMNAATIASTIGWVSEKDDIQVGEYYPEITLRVKCYEGEDL